VIKIDKLNDDSIGSFPVKITSHIGDVKSARDIDFKVNLFLDECLQGGVLPTTTVNDFEYKVVEKQPSYNIEIIGTQDMATNVKNIASCKSTITNTVQVQLPNTHAWVDFTENNAPQITKYLKYDSATKAFEARVKEGDSPEDNDDFKAEVRLYTTVLHEGSKRLIGEGLSASWEYNVAVDKREEDKCNVEYLKMDWTTSSAVETGKPTGRRLQG